MKKAFNDIQQKYKDMYLFKRDIKGNVIYWFAKVNKSYCNIEFYHGRINSEFITENYKSFTHIKEGTNIGKSSETTSVEQCYKQLDSEYKDHIKKGYKHYNFIDNRSAVDYLETVVDQTNTDALGFAKPMKCQKFELGKVNYPCIGQPKYNGVRATVCIDYTCNEMFNETPIIIISKEGVRYKLEHLNAELYNLLKGLEARGINTPVLDGEIYLPNTQVTTIGGAARNEKNTINSQLQYVIYDLSIENMCQLDRLYMLDSSCSMIAFHHNGISNRGVYLSPRFTLKDDEESLALLDKCLAAGYEGAVTRQYEPEYAFGQRPMFMRKLKKFEDAEFELIDIVEYGDRDQAVGYGCKFICRNDITNDTFEVMPKGTSTERMNYFLNKDTLIGKQVTIKFYERTINKLPFHATAIAGFRDYETPTQAHE